MSREPPLVVLTVVEGATLFRNKSERSGGRHRTGDGWSSPARHSITAAAGLRAVPVVASRQESEVCRVRGREFGLAPEEEAANNFGSWDTCGADLRRRQPKRLQPMRAGYRTAQGEGGAGWRGGSGDDYWCEHGVAGERKGRGRGEDAPESREQGSAVFAPAFAPA